MIVRALAFLILGATCALVAACTSAGGSTGSSPVTSSAPAGTPRWTQYLSMRGVVDMAGPLGGGAYVLSANGRLFLYHPAANTPVPFARGPGGYQTHSNEPYLTVAAAAAGPGCEFSDDQIYALETGTKPPGVIMIDSAGQAHRFADLPAAEFLSGIAFDMTGRFGHRLLVTGSQHGQTTVSAIDCGGRVTPVATIPAPTEGGITVAPAVFGRYGGDLIAADEQNGNVYAVAPGGQVSLLAASGIPHGGDIGVESPGFVPLGFTAAYLADRF